MKKILLITAVLVFAFILTNESKANTLPGGGYGYFYSSLAPHGEWFELDNGVTVWRPFDVRRDWAPYTDGEWVWTEDGWFWNSYEPFGYITYHYGRWYNDDYYGWIWVPDDQWAPAWVEWRYDDDYIGWAPLSPYAAFSINIGLHFSYDYHTPYNHWHFVKYRYFCDPYVANYYVGPKYRYRIYSHTKYRTDYGYERGRVVNRGVDINHIRKMTGQNIREREVIRTSDPREINNGRGNDKIRTFIATRDELQKETRNVDIKRADRRTTLETSKVEFGRRNDIDKRNAVDSKKERTQERGVERVGGDNRNGSEGIRSTNPGINTREGVRNTNPETNTRERVQNSTPETNKRERVQNSNSESNKRESVRSTTPQINREPRVERKVESAPREKRVEQPRQQRIEQPREQKRNEPVRTERRGGNERNDSNNKDRRTR